MACAQHTATHCNSLQLTATHCNSLQLTATHCNSLHTTPHCDTAEDSEHGTLAALSVAAATSSPADTTPVSISGIPQSRSSNAIWSRSEGGGGGQLVEKGGSKGVEGDSSEMVVDEESFQVMQSLFDLSCDLAKSSQGQRTAQRSRCIYVYIYICMCMYIHMCMYVYMYMCICTFKHTQGQRTAQRSRCIERWGAGVETQKNVRGEIGGWGRVPFHENYAPSLSTIYDGV